MAIALEDTIWLTVITTLIIQFLKVVWCGIFKQAKPTAGVMRIVVFAVALIYGYFASEIDFPVYEDPMKFFWDLVEIGGVIMITADRAYHVILKPILEWLDAKVSGKLAFLVP